MNIKSNQSYDNCSFKGMNARPLKGIFMTSDRILPAQASISNQPYHLSHLYLFY